ncbi:ATP-binding protein [Streptomyces niveus]|uniref:ATP-binding protein n=1 Tax=Streptomyces niveus TaxID=193462 RepID=UPI0038339057
MSRQGAVDRLVLVALSEAVGRAREFAAEALRSWGVVDALDDVVLVASELVTNAVRATGQKAGHRVAVQLRVAGRSLYIEVWDNVPGVPEVKHLEADAEGGRGLQLVEALTTRWGICQPRSGGKVVWAELPLPGVPEPPPGGVPPLGPEFGAELLADVALMERALEALRGL